jgi:4-amino-4-deoxy-L-arabinose transferase-like glycosyltransferase
VLLGGLCAGLAIQTKFNFLAAIGVLGLCWLVTDFRATRKVPFVRWAAAAVGVALPTAAFEVYRYRSLGDGYGANLRETKAFLDTQSQTPAREVVLDRSRVLFELLSSPGLAMLVLAVVVVLASLVGRQLAARSGNSTQAAALLDPGQRSLVAGVLLAALTLAAMWITISIQPSLRQGLPALLVALPALAALTARVLTAPAGADARTRTTSRLAAGVCGVALVLVVLGAGVQIARGSDSDALLVQQRAAAEVIERSGTPSLPVQGWWMLAEFQVLTDLPVANHPGAEPPTIKVFSPVRALIERGRPDSREFLDQCTEVLYAEWGALVCR